VQISMKRIDIQKYITVEALLNSRVIGLVISSEFTRRKKRFKLRGQHI